MEVNKHDILYDNKENLSGTIIDISQEGVISIFWSNRTFEKTKFDDLKKSIEEQWVEFITWDSLVSIWRNQVSEERRKEKREGRARDQASAQMDNISSMVARLKHCDDCDGKDCELTDKEICDGLNIYYQEGKTEVTAEDRENYHDREAAEEHIHEDPLDVEIRSDWHTPGGESESSDFTILLCTGGPACRIVGELDSNNSPDRAWLEYQDWGTSWIEYHDENLDTDALLTYAQQFYFEE